MRGLPPKNEEDAGSRYTEADSPHFLGRYTGGRSKPSPLRREIQMRRGVSTEPFEISDRELETAVANSRTPSANTAHGAPGKANAKAKANTDPSPLKGIRDDSREAAIRDDSGEDFFPRPVEAAATMALGRSLEGRIGARGLCPWGRRLVGSCLLAWRLREWGRVPIGCGGWDLGIRNLYF
jgi:hypothetical protein